MGCFFFTVPIYGLLSSIGLFQTYWRKHQLQDFSESEVSWIISMFGFMDCLFGSPAGILFDKYGVRWLLPLATIMYLSCFVGLAFSSNYGGFMGPAYRLGSSSLGTCSSRRTCPDGRCRMMAGIWSRHGGCPDRPSSGSSAIWSFVSAEEAMWA